MIDEYWWTRLRTRPTLDTFTTRTIYDFKLPSLRALVTNSMTRFGWDQSLCLLQKSFCVSIKIIFIYPAANLGPGGHLVLVDAKLVLDPREHFGTLETGVEVALALELTRLELAQIWVVASDQIGVNILFALPRVKVVDLAQLCGRSHPLYCLVVGDKPNVLFLDHLVDESHQRAEVALLLEPDGVKVQAEWRPVGCVVALEVGAQHVEHFVLG